MPFSWEGLKWFISLAPHHIADQWWINLERCGTENHIRRENCGIKGKTWKKGIYVSNQREEMELDWKASWEVCTFGPWTKVQALRT